MQRFLSCLETIRAFGSRCLLRQEMHAVRLYDAAAVQRGAQRNAYEKTFGVYVSSMFTSWRWAVVASLCLGCAGDDVEVGRKLKELSQPHKNEI